MNAFKHRFTIFEVCIYWISVLLIGLSIGNLFYDFSRQFCTVMSFGSILLMLGNSLILMKREKIPKESFLLHLILTISLFLFTAQTSS